MCSNKFLFKKKKELCPSNWTQSVSSGPGHDLKWDPESQFKLKADSGSESGYKISDTSLIKK